MTKLARGAAVVAYAVAVLVVYALVGPTATAAVLAVIPVVIGLWALRLFDRDRAQRLALTQSQHALEIEVAVRRRAETEIAQQQKQLQLLIDHASDIVAVLETDGRVRQVSPAITRWLGYAPDELVGRNVFELVHPDDLSRVIASFREGIENPGVLQRADFSYRHKDGTWRILETIGNNLFEDGKVVGVVVSSRDVTDRRRAEDALRTAERQSEQSDKLRAMGQMASGIAHDLNQSLALIAGYSELARESLAQPKADTAGLSQMLAIVGQAALDGGATLKRLLAFARGPSVGPPEVVDAHSLLQDVAQLTAPRWRDAAQASGRPITLRVEVAGDAVIRGWAAQLREALTNLIFNAIDAMPNGGTIQLAAVRRGSVVDLSVADEGVGIPAEVQGRVFEPFFTTKGESGTGLGLAQVFAIVEAHEGKTALTSAPGAGTTVTLTLPATGSEAALQRSPEPEPSAKTIARRILAVDDEPGLADLVAHMLGRRGHTVVTANSGEEGLRRLESGPFDVVISDLGMGTGMSGWDLANQVRARWPDTRFILATGWGAQIDDEDARRHGVAVVIAKPYRVAELERALGSVAEAPARAGG